MKKVITLFVLFLLFVTNSFAQKWLWATEASVGGGEGAPISIDKDGNSYLIGTSDSILTFGTYTLSSSRVNLFMYIVKYDANGNVLWANQSKCEENSLGYAFGTSVINDIYGNVYVTGFFYDTISIGSITLRSTTESSFLVKYNSNGRVLWAKQSVNPPYPSVGIISSVVTDKSGNIYITGQYSDTINFGPYRLIAINGPSIFIAKYDTNGNVLWAEQPQVNNTSNFQDFSNSIAIDKFNDIYIAGTFANTITFGSTTLTIPYSVLDDVFIAKIDSNGNNLWAEAPVPLNYFLNSVDDEGFGIATDKLGNSYITGFYNDTLIFGIDTLPNYLVQNIFLVKYDINGNAIWARSPTVLEGPGFISFVVATDTINNIYLVGGDNNGQSTGDEIVFGTDTIRIGNSYNDGNSILVKYDSSGEVLCGVGINGGGDDNNGIAVDPSGNYVYFGGDLANSVRFGPDSLIVDRDNEIPFMAKWQPCGVNDAGINIIPEIESRLYPNPNNGQFNIVTSSVTTNSKLEIYNMLGQEVYNSTLNSKENMIKMNNPIPSIYLYRIVDTQNELILNGKFIVE